MTADPASCRLPLVDIETMQGEVGETLRSLPMRLNIIAMAANAETCIIPQLQLGQAVMTGQLLAPLHRELLILLAAAIDDSPYVWSQHTTIAMQVGADESKIAALKSLDLSSEAFDDKERALLAFGQQVVRGAHVDDAAFANVASHFNAREIMEAILAIGYYMTMNRITAVTRTPLETGATG